MIQLVRYKKPLQIYYLCISLKQDYISCFSNNSWMFFQSVYIVQVQVLGAIVSREGLLKVLLTSCSA